MKYQDSKISFSEYELVSGHSPFPYFVVDSFLSEELLDEMQGHWPAQKYFCQEGHNGHDLRSRLAEYQFTSNDQLELAQHSTIPNMDKRHGTFWANFIDGTLVPVGKEMIRYYSGYLKDRWPDKRPDYFINLVWLEDAPQKYREIGLRVHTHYDHDPFWAMSGLIYLNDSRNIAKGTNLQRFEVENLCSDDLVDIALNSRRWYQDERFQVEQEFTFKKNRFLSFVDGPLSFHGVQPNNLQADGQLKRKMVLFHIALHPKHFQPHFGVHHHVFKNQVMTHQATEDIRQVVAQDIAAYRRAIENFVPYGCPDYANSATLQAFDEISGVI